MKRINSLSKLCGNFVAHSKTNNDNQIMSRFIVAVVWTLIPFLLSSFLLAQDETAANDTQTMANNLASVQLQWSDGDQIDGQLLGWRDDLIQLDSQVFESPVGVRSGLVDTVRFTHRSEARADVGQHRLTLADGSALVGTFISAKDNLFQFKDYRFGEISIDATKVAKVESNAKVGYAWDGEIKPWQIQSGQWTIDAEQRLHTSQADSKVWLPLPLGDSFAIELEIVSPQSLDLILATGQDPEKSYRLAKIGDSWIVGSRDDFEIIDSLSDRQRQLTLKLLRNATTGKLILMQGENVLVEVADKQSTSDHSGILLHNVGHSLSLKTLRVFTDQQTGDTGSLSSPTELPKMTGTVVEPAPRSMDRLVFKDGSRIWGTVTDFSKSSLTVQIDQLGITSTCSIQQLASITPREAVLSKSNSDAAGEPKSQMQTAIDCRLQQGQSKLFGSSQFQTEPLSVRWQSDKLDRPALLNTRLPISLHRQNGKAQTIEGLQQASQIALLKSGAMIPVQLDRANTAYTWLRTPFSKAVVQVNNQTLRAVELWPKRNKASFTKESREMLLSIPRNLEADHFSHALIGQNGDLLRGNLVAVSEQSIEIDSRNEPLLVERVFVDTLLFLQPSSEADPRVKSKNAGESPSNAQPRWA